VALRFARDASLVPNEVTPEHFRALRLHWDDGQIVEILAVVGLFGFLNRWNDTMATQVEGQPRAIAQDRFGNNFDHPAWRALWQDAGTVKIWAGLRGSTE
jgi:hypothetical protein